MSGAPNPPEDELKLALRSLKEENPTLGVSENRVRKVLQSEGLSPSTAGGRPKKIWPSSKVNETLDVTQFCKKIQVKYFDKAKGKGLIAKEDIGEGEILWKEDPFVLAPEWEIYDLQIQGQHCGQCSSRLSTESDLVTSCASSTTEAPCPMLYCNRLCQRRSLATHPLLCPAQNPSSSLLLQFARKAEWLALHALAQCTSRILLASQLPGDNEQIKTDWEVFKGLAVLGMEERFKDAGKEPDRDVWRQCFQLHITTFREPKSSGEQKKLGRILKKPVPEEVEKELFTYDGFLRGLGRMSLNLESHGGIYALHSHINHDCTPNASIRHIDPKTALSRITVIARQFIAEGDELTVTYVDPSLSVKRRRQDLAEWGFGECQCKKCLTEAKAEKEKEKHSGEPQEKEAAIEDLENELKAGFGVK